MDANIVDIFYLVDEFCKEFDKAKEGHILQEDCSKKSRKRQFRMSDSEIIMIMIYFHLKQFRNLKHFYVNYILEHCNGYFPDGIIQPFCGIATKSSISNDCLTENVLFGKMYRDFLH